MSKSFAALLTAFLAWGVTSAAEVPADYPTIIAQARADRVARLRHPDGYLALTASGWLQPGENTVGSAVDNQFRVSSAPAHLGSLQLSSDGTVRLHLIDTNGVIVNGQPARMHDVALQTQGATPNQTPTRVGFNGSYLYVVENGAQRGLRVKNNATALRLHFPGFDYFPVDPSWRISARWVPFQPPEHLRIAYVTGTEEDVPVPGKAVFERDGRTYELRPMEEDGRLFFVFRDRTSGKQTYGGARFLYADTPKDGKVLLDFNLAQNPPCAITPHVVCPLAPPENRLTLPVTAGEKRFPEERYSAP